MSSTLNTARGERIRALRKEAGLSQDQLAKIIGVSRNAVSLWEKGEEITSQNLRALAEKFKVSISYIDSGDLGANTAPRSDAKPVVEKSTVGAISFDRGADTADTWPRNLKIIGHVKAGVEGFFLDQGEHHGMAYRPPILRDVKGAFAVYVQDESMVPAFEPGMVAWIHPTRPVAPGNNIIIELSDGQAFIKRLVRRTAKEVICLQYEPKKEIRYPAARVKHLYLVVGSYRED